MPGIIRARLQVRKVTAQALCISLTIVCRFSLAPKTAILWAVETAFRKRRGILLS